VQRYGDLVWEDLFDLWTSLNGLLLHVMSQIPKEKMNLQCRIGIAEPVPLSKLVDNYVEHVQDVVAQILAHL